MVIDDGPTSVPAVELSAGLVNGDDVVNINDLSAAAAAIGDSQCCRLDAQGRFTDMDGSGSVNINDVSAVVSSFGVVAPANWP